MEIKIKAIAYYLPEGVFDNAQANELFPEWSVDKISGKTGIYERHITDASTCSSDLAVAASKLLFKQNNISPESVDYILLCTQSPDYFLPTTACLVQDKLGVPTSAGAIDFNLGCSGYIYGLSLAKGLIMAGDARNVLLITAETYSKFIHPRDKSNRTIFGDAAAATLVSNEGFASIGGSSLGTDGTGAGNLIVKRGGLRYPRTEGDDIKMDEYGNALNENFLYMNGTEIFNFTSQMVPKLVEQTLARNKVRMEDIDLFVFHQANKFMLNHLRKKLQIPEEKFFYFMESCGNTVSSTIPIALLEARNQGVLKKGFKVMLAGFGVGYSWGGVVLNID